MDPQGGSHAFLREHLVFLRFLGARGPLLDQLLPGRVSLDSLHGGGGRTPRRHMQTLSLRHDRPLQALDWAPVFPADTPLQLVFREPAGPIRAGGKKGGSHKVLMLIKPGGGSFR